VGLQSVSLNPNKRQSRQINPSLPSLSFPSPSLSFPPPPPTPHRKTQHQHPKAPLTPRNKSQDYKTFLLSLHRNSCSECEKHGPYGRCMRTRIFFWRVPEGGWEGGGGVGTAGWWGVVGGWLMAGDEGGGG